MANQRYEYTKSCEDIPSSMARERDSALDDMKFNWSRQQYKRAYQDIIRATTLERITELANINFMMVESQNNCNELCVFKQQYGYCNVPNKYEQNMKLERWASYQRIRYKHDCKSKLYSMTSEHITAVESIDFQWNFI